MGKADVLAVKAFDIAHHLRLGMVLLEDIRLHVVDVANAALVDSPQPLEGFLGLLILRLIACQFGEEVDEVVHIVKSNSLVKANAYEVFAVIEVDASVEGFFLEGVYVFDVETEGIEELNVILLYAVSLHQFIEINSASVNTFGYLANAFCTVINAIEPCHHCAESLSGTDIGSGFLAFDMLFAGLQSQTVSGMVIRIFAQTDDTSGHITFELITGSHIAGSGTAKAHRQTETLCRTAHNICV